VTTRVAAIDCGTNSIRLLVAETEPDGPGAARLHDLDRRMEIVRLGQGVDRTGRIDSGALERTLVALQTYADVAASLGATAVRMVATSATRDAANAVDFVAGVRAILGVDPEVISGDEEAALSYRGATAGVSERLAPSPRLVVDIGGGSTEFVLGEGGAVLAARSVDIGCVRMTERHLDADPPTSEQAQRARDDIDAAIDLAAAVVPIERAHSLVGLAGSVTTVAAIHLGLDVYDSTAIHGSLIPAAEVRRISDMLLAMPHRERATMGVMHPGRVDVIAAGALVLRRIVDRLDVPHVVVSEHDILDGIAWSLVEA
jgi:exopolyphosphatase / guanosine-5'-triphosphate,3'-diphosphate pyrophosphatase